MHTVTSLDLFTYSDMMCNMYVTWTMAPYTFDRMCMYTQIIEDHT